MTALLTRTADPEAVRAAAVRLASASDDRRRAADLLARTSAGLAQEWTGTAADGALTALVLLTRAASASADAHERAAGALRSCAGRLEDARALQARADRLTRLAAVQRAAGLDADTDLQAWRLREQAAELAADAEATTAAVLDELQPTITGLDLSDQLTGVARGAWTAVWGSVELLAGLSLPRLLLDRDGWTDDVLSLRDGGRYAREHPGDAAEAMAGLDQLQAGQYGEWLGSLLPDLLGGVVSGGALPAGRRALDAASDLARLADRLPDAGGPVVLPDGADVPAGYVTRVADLTPERRQHILGGDKTGGGHRAGTGHRGKTEFPAAWSDDDIIRAVMETARSPQSGFLNTTHGNHNVSRTFDGVTVTVAVDRSGNVVTAFPLKGGPGVVKNPW